VGAAETLGGLQKDRLDNTIRVLVDLAVPEPNNRPALGLEKRRASLVALGICML